MPEPRFGKTLSSEVFGASSVTPKGGMMRSAIAAALAGGLVFVGVGLAARAQTLNDATAAYAKGDYATAVKDLRPLAEQGFALAQVDLGAMYHDGQGVTKDDVQAANWYRKAADQGDADGQFRLGMSYYEGWGLTQDFAQAAALFQKSADQGDASAMGMLAACYDAGQGVPQSYVTADMWMSLSLAGLPDPNSSDHQAAAQSLAKIAAHLTAAQIAQARQMASARHTK